MNSKEPGELVSKWVTDRSREVTEMHLSDENACEEEALCGVGTSDDNRKVLPGGPAGRHLGWDQLRGVQGPDAAVRHGLAQDMEAEGLPDEAEEYRQLSETLSRETGQNLPGEYKTGPLIDVWAPFCVCWSGATGADPQGRPAGSPIRWPALAHPCMRPSLAFSGPCWHGQFDQTGHLVSRPIFGRRFHRWAVALSMSRSLIHWHVCGPYCASGGRTSLGMRVNCNLRGVVLIGDVDGHQHAVHGAEWVCGGHYHRVGVPGLVV